MNRAFRACAPTAMLLTTLTSAVAVQAAAPTPSELEQADAHFKQGVQLFKTADYEAALVEFRKAQTIVPDWHVLFNIGRTCGELHDAACAVTAYRRYLREGAELPSERVADVQAELTRLEPAVGVVHFTASEPNAELSLDDLPLDVAESASGVIVNIGRHRLSARFSIGTVDSRAVDVASGDEVTVSLVPPRAPTPPAPRAAAALPGQLDLRAAPPARDASDFPLWPGWVATSAFAVGGTAAGLLALSSRSQAKRDASDTNGHDALDAANGKTHTLAAVADALFGAAAIAGSVTLYFTLKAPAEPAPPKAHVALEVAPGALRLGYRF